MATYISNAFSLGMVEGNTNFGTREVDLPVIAHKLNNPVSIVGHADTAKVFSDALGIEVAHNRQSVTLTPNDTLYVGQLQGGRLPEGATELPDGFEIKWLCVRLSDPGRPLERSWTEGGSSHYGAIDRAAQHVADFVGGKVKLMQDGFGNPFWDVEAPGFTGSFHDG